MSKFTRQIFPKYNLSKLSTVQNLHYTVVAIVTKPKINTHMYPPWQHIADQVALSVWGGTISFTSNWKAACVTKSINHNNHIIWPSGSSSNPYMPFSSVILSAFAILRMTGVHRDSHASLNFTWQSGYFIMISNWWSTNNHPLHIYLHSQYLHILGDFKSENFSN